MLPVNPMSLRGLSRSIGGCVNVNSPVPGAIVNVNGSEFKHNLEKIQTVPVANLTGR